MNVIRPFTVSLLMLCLPLAVPTMAIAQNATQPTAQAPRGSQEEQSPPEIANGDATHAWIQAQKNGALASKQRQTLSGPVMSKVYSEYVKSFDRNGASTGTDATAKK